MFRSVCDMSRYVLHVKCEEMFFTLRWQGNGWHTVATVYVRQIAMLLSIVRQHGYYHHIVMLLCSTDCNIKLCSSVCDVTMFKTLQHYYIFHVVTSGFVHQIVISGMFVAWQGWFVFNTLRKWSFGKKK